MLKDIGYSTLKFSKNSKNFFFPKWNVSTTKNILQSIAHRNSNYFRSYLNLKSLYYLGLLWNIVFYFAFISEQLKNEATKSMQQKHAKMLFLWGVKRLIMTMCLSSVVVVVIRISSFIATLFWYKLIYFIIKIYMCLQMVVTQHFYFKHFPCIFFS